MFQLKFFWINENGGKDEEMICVRSGSTSDSGTRQIKRLFWVVKLTARASRVNESMV